MKVQLQRAIDELLTLQDSWSVFVDRETGEIVPFPDADPAQIDADARARFEQLEEADRLIRLPSPAELPEETVAENFVRRVDDPDAARRLDEAFRGPGGLGRFHDELLAVQLRDAYQDALAEALRREIVADLEAEGLDYE